MADDVLSPNLPIITRAEAKAAGLTRYYPGVPCQNGHMAERDRRHKCVECARLRCERYKAANPDRLKATQAKHRAKRLAENPEKVKAAQRARNQRYFAVEENRAKNVARCRARYADDPEAARAISREWRAANREKSRQMAKSWQAANPDRKAVIASNNRARRRGAEGKHTAADIRRIYDEQKGKCACCREKITAGYHKDHIIPLARGGSNWSKNIQLLCGPCNQAKHARDPVEFMRSLGRLL